MTKLPQMTGDTYADIVVWKWDRRRMRWTANLRDGTTLVVALQRFGKRSFWNPFMNGEPLIGGYKHPDAAEDAALVEWKKRSGAVT